MSTKKLAKTNAQRQATFRRRRTNSERCIDCGKKIGPLGTKSRCRPCAEAHRERSADKRQNDPFYGKPKDRKEHQKWLEDNTLPSDFTFTPVVIPRGTPKEEFNPITKKWEEIP